MIRRRCICRTMTCRADNLAHFLRIHWRWLGDRHDASIWRKVGA